MTLVTGTPLGTINTQDEIYLDTAPPIYFQDYSAGLLNTPDGNGFYWGLSGTSTYPVFELGCIEGVQLNGSIEMNDIRCDTVGNKGTIQKLNNIDLVCNLKTFLPLSTFKHIIRGGAVTTGSGLSEQFGMGQPNNQQFYHVWLPSVYDEDAGDYLGITLFKVQFVDSWSIAFNYGQPSTVGIMLRAFADTTKPAAQLFGSFLRADASAIA